LADARVAPSIAATALGHTSIQTTLDHYYPGDWESAEKALRETHRAPETPTPANITFLKQTGTED
ncbi:MAG: hypothetical protein KDD73_17590, partial [Anaerolineales bacterium]|nr:hypothetical protein [Anaerolineales bacterium]